MGRHSCGNPRERPNPYPQAAKACEPCGPLEVVSLGGDAPHALHLPFMDLAMFGLHVRVPDPKAKQEAVGVPPARTTAPLICHCITWCAVAGQYQCRRSLGNWGELYGNLACNRNYYRGNERRVVLVEVYRNDHVSLQLVVLMTYS